MKSILFVSEVPSALEEMRALMWPVSHEWHMMFVPSASEALRTMEQRPFDVLVADMASGDARARGEGGLIAEAAHRHPDMVRLALVEREEEAASLRSLGAAHEYLPKPFNPEAVVASATRALTLRALLHSASLKRIVAQIDSLPTVPMLYLRLLDELRSPEPSIVKAASLIASDVGMSAKILQLVNSAFFAFRHYIQGVRQAVTLLGLRTTKDLVLSVKIFSQFDDSRLPGFSIDQVSSHCVSTATLAKVIADAEDVHPGLVDDTFMAGLLHDVGKLIFADKLPHLYAKAFDFAAAHRVPLWEAEERLFGATHAEIGAYLMGLWGVPDPIVEALAYHHCPTACRSTAFSPLTALHVADVLDNETDRRPRRWPTAKVDYPYLESLGLQDRLTRWMELARGLRHQQQPVG